MNKLREIQNKLTGELNPGSLIRISGLPQAGKTDVLVRSAVIEALSRDQSKFDVVIFVSREEQPDEITRRALFYTLKHLGQIPEGMTIEQAVSGKISIDEETALDYWSNINFVYMPMSETIGVGNVGHSTNTLFLIDGFPNIDDADLKEAFTSNGNALAFTKDLDFRESSDFMEYDADTSLGTNIPNVEVECYRQGIWKNNKKR